MEHIVSLDGKNKAEFVKKMHAQARLHIEKKTQSYASHANKGRKALVFEPGDLVWVHLRKERFPQQRKSKLQPRGDGPFKVLERINPNAYKIDLPSEYGVSNTFNVIDLSPYFGVGPNSRSNFSQEGGDDEGAPSLSYQGPITRAKAKELQSLIMEVCGQEEAIGQGVISHGEAIGQVEEFKCLTLCQVDQRNCQVEIN